MNNMASDNIAREVIDKSVHDHVALRRWDNLKEHSLTYQQLNTESQIFAQQLIKIGIKSGDRVVLLAESRRFEWVIALFAIWQVNATAILIDSTLTPQDFRDLVQRADPQAIVTNAHFASVFEKMETPPLMDIDAGGILFDRIRKSPAMDGDPAVACIIFTSGTTGTPQGVMLSHENILFVARRSIAIADLKLHDQVLGVLPLHHVFGLVNVFISSLLAGASVTLVEKIRSDEILMAMKNSKITTLAATPRLLELIYRQIVHQVEQRNGITKTIFNILKYCCGKWRTFGWGNPALHLFKPIQSMFGGHLSRIISGGAPLSKEVFILFEQIGWTVVEGYGLTETAGIVAGNTMQRRVAGTVGHPVEGVKLLIDRPNAAGEGEICISGPNVMKGYFRDSTATAEAIRNGWLHTGDIGHLDKEGDLIISGRIKEMIVTASGKKAMPADIEQRYKGIPGILEMAVLGMKSLNQIGEEIHAAIIVDQQVCDEREIEDRIVEVSKTVPMHLRIHQLHFVSQIPKTSTMKVKRNELRILLMKKPAVVSIMDSTEPENDETTQKVLENLNAYISSKGCGRVQITPSSSLQFDLGIDSLDRLELAAALEKSFEVEINEAALFQIDKVRDLCTLIKHAPHLKHQHPESESYALPSAKGILNRCFFSNFKFFSNCFWKTHVEGIENIPQHGPIILCANHQSYLDAYWIFAYLPSRIREEAFCIARKELADDWKTALLARPVNIIPTDRDGDALPAIKMSLAALAQKRSILIFPEGNRSRSGEMRPFRRGAAHLALRAGVPIIPVSIEGAFQIFPRHQLLPNLFNWKKWQRYPLTLKFGKPIFPSSNSHYDKDAEERLIGSVKKAIQELSL